MESRRERLRIGLAHKQQVIFLVMLAVGGGLLTASLLSGPYVAEGIAFMLVGLAGLLMSWTTFDIGAGIKEVVREVGRENREAVREVGRENREAVREVGRESREALDRTLDRILEAQRESQKETRELIAESQKETRELIGKMSESQDRISKSQDSIARLLERVVKNSGA